MGHGGVMTRCFHGDGMKQASDHGHRRDLFTSYPGP